MYVKHISEDKFCVIQRPSWTCANNVHAPFSSQRDFLYEAVQPDYYWDSLSHSRPIWYLLEVSHR